MAKAHKCDRCGNYYEKNNNRLIPNGFSKATMAAIMPLTISNDHGRRYDLCDDCANEFMKFINMEETDD